MIHNEHTCNKNLNVSDLPKREIYLSVGINNNCKGNVLHAYIKKDSIEYMHVLIKCKLYSNFIYFFMHLVQHIQKLFFCLKVKFYIYKELL